MRDIAFAAREYLARHNITAQQIADHLGKPIDYVLDQLTDETPLGVGVVFALAALRGDSPQQVAKDLASIAAVGGGPSAVDGGSMSRALAREIRAQRITLSMSPERLACLAGEPSEAITMYESGDLPISIDVPRRIAAALETSPSEIMRAAQRRATSGANG